MNLLLAERLLFPAGRAFVPFPVRRGVLRLLEREAVRDPALAKEVYRLPPDADASPRAWVTARGQTWLRLEAALAGAGCPESAADWLALHGPCESVAERAFVENVFAPTLGAGGLRSLRSQEAFPLPDGGVGRIDFVVVLQGVRVAIEIDGIDWHEGPGPDGHRPEHERDRQNALVAAGYVLLRFTGREVLQDPVGTGERLRRDLEALGLLDGGAGDAQVEPLPISPTTHAFLGPWPRNFVRAQQAALDLVRTSPEWLASPMRRVLMPRSDRGAAALGLLDALDVICTALRLTDAEPGLRRLELWVGDHSEAVRALVEDRTSGANSPQLPFVVEIFSGPSPDDADTLFISATADDLTDAELVALLGGVVPDAQIVWCSDVDASATATIRADLSFFKMPPRAAIEHLLERFFGFTAFRDGQWEIVEQLLMGRSALGVLPTGAGKTVCFQLPALLQPGVTLVVSPLVSLMDDQVMNLRGIGLDFAGRAHSRLSDDEAEEELRRFAAGNYKLFYVSPERFHSLKFVNQLSSLTRDHGLPISYFVVDEAHLASEWGHDFRPSYLTLPEAHAAICPKAPVALLTATAPRQIRDDLAAIFRKTCSLNMVLPPTFDRPELSFQVCRVVNDTERQDKILDLVRDQLPKSLGFNDFDDLHGLTAASDQVTNGGLVFTPWGKPGEKRPAIRAAMLASTLQERGIPAAEYRTSTGDGETGDRAAVNRHTQERFKRNELPLVVATKGFGTGIDKPDIRYVIHADMPGSLEALYQEAGRAGRDGRDARAAMVWRPRPGACRPEKGAPVCATTGKCPHGLGEELCSFGVQARLRQGNQPGAATEIETSLTLWRAYFAQGADAPERRVPRSTEVEAITRNEVLDHTSDILRRLQALELCGAPWAPLGLTKPVFVDSRVFSPDVVRQRVQAIRPGARSPKGSSDESFIFDALRIAFQMSERDAHDHTAVWAMYLRHRQVVTDKKSPVPRAAGQDRSQQRPDVERFLARLVTLGVARTYRYEGKNDWLVEMSAPVDQSSADLERRLADSVARHHGTPSKGEPLPARWSEAVEAALTRLVRSWYDTIAVRSWETLESLEEFAGARDCRRRRIAQYMNESAVTIQVPCGHCDNCGIKALGEQRPITVDDQIRRRVSEFNVGFDALAAQPGEMGAVAGVLNLARLGGLLGAVRDRAARHLEHSPFDLAPRLAAALAAHELGESQVAERHLRMLIETLAQAGAVSDLSRLSATLPRNLVAAVAPDARRLLADIPPADRDMLTYGLQYRCGTAGADTLAVIIRRAAQPFVVLPAAQETEDGP